MRRSDRGFTFLVAVATLSLTACTGPTGSQGDPGAAGAAGDKGAAGQTGKDGKDGTNGQDGTAAATTGILSGTVTDAVAKDALADVAVTVKDSGGVVLGTGTTDANGKFSIDKIPAGGVVLSMSKQYWTSPGDTLVGVLAGKTVDITTALSEAATGKPSLTVAMVGNDFGYAGAAQITASANSPTGSTLTYAWKNATVPAIGSVEGKDNNATVTLPTLTAAFAKRVEDPKTPLQYISGYTLPARFGIIPILPDTRGEMSVSVTVTDNRGQSASASVTVDAASPRPGVANVAMGSRVYLNSGHDASNAWTLDIAGAPGSKAALDSAASRTPSFVADVKGAYVLTENNNAKPNTITIYAGDWTGAITGGAGSVGNETVIPDNTCVQCHAPNGFAPDQFTPWAKTNHAIMFAKGLVGDNGTHYSGSCLGCHTVGFDNGVANGGFDDVALANTWSFPNNNYAATNWTDFVSKQPALVKLAGIQCENCHGPQNSAGHKNGNSPQTPANALTREYGNPRIAFSAETCASCHASGTGHHFYSEWATLDPKTGWGHSNRATITLGSNASGLSSSCGRCHTAQGFKQYSDQIQTGNPGSLLVTAGVTPANAEPVTCTACHDPHDAKNPNQLRLYGDTQLLAAGFSMYGIGKGALCITCHNSRNATYNVNGVYAGTYLHEDGEKYNSGNPTGYSAPHQACQGDVFAGHNAYFMGNSLPMTSRHAAIEDACVGCHMAKNPESHLSHGAPAVSSHVFRIMSEDKGALCSQCHAAGVDGEGIQAQVEAGLKNLSAKIGKTVVARANGNTITVVAYDATADQYSIAPGAAKNPNALVPLQIDTTTNPLISAAIEEIHGQVGYLLTFTNAMDVQLVDSNGVPSKLLNTKTFAVQMGNLLDNQVAPKALYTLSSKLVRAGWNYFLVEGDQSLGMHNPSFVMSVLNATMAQDLSL